MLKIGIIGTGRIANRFISDAWQKSGFTVSSVYNPHIESARAFVSIHSDALKKGGVEVEDVLITDDLEVFVSEVDAAYIASPHDTHYSYAKKLLEAGKNVLCEKPMSFFSNQVEELYSLAGEKNLILMEAIKTAYCPGFLELMETLETGIIGDVVEVEACFTRLTNTNTREWNDIEFGGSFTELGSYVIYPVLKLLGSDYQNITFKSRYGGNGLDAFTKVDFEYDNKMASCKVGIGAKSEGQMIITGTKGYIVVAAPWWLTSKFQVRFEDPNKVEEHACIYKGSGLSYECEAFYEKITHLSVLFDEEDKKAFWKYAFEVTADDSLQLARVFEVFLNTEKNRRDAKKIAEDIKIWGHRGCSMRFPENSLEAFLEAAKTPGVTGVELDVQLTSDGELVVFHDENVARVTDGDKRVVDYSLAELKNLILAPNTDYETSIPTLEEVLAALQPYCKNNGFMINIELKTSVIHYEGIEQMTYDMVEKYDLQENIVYSSFWAESVKKMKEIDPENKTGMLSSSLSECIRLGRYAGVDALHPWIGGLDCIIPEDMKDYPVRAWNGEEPFYYNDNRVLKEHNLEKYSRFGVTEIITNVPENYV